jgi:glycosyltransferase involved in cell wall biosynthesis
MRIVHVVLGYYPSQIWGGVPPVVDTLSKNLHERGHDVAVLATNILDYHSSIYPDSRWGEWNGVPVLYLKTHWRGRRNNSVGFIWTPDLWRYRHVFRDADIVHMHGYRTFMFVGATLLAWRYNVPLLVQPHGSLPSEFGRVRLKKVFDRTIGPFMLRRADKCIALATSEAALLNKYGVAQEKVVTLGNPLDTSLCPVLPDPQVFRQRFALGADEKMVLFLSRLHEKKGPDLLIRAVAALDRADVRLCMVGPDDGFEATARELVRDLGIQDRVTFTGPLYGEEKFAAYRAADVYVLSTRGAEGLPMTVLEALYAGTPVITTSTTDISGLIHERAGTAIEFDVDSLKQALEDIIDNPARRAAYAQQAPMLIKEHFEPDTIVARLEKLYQDCLI